MKTVLTYGTFDLFHIGHLRLLERLSSLGDRLVVGVSTDEFNATKGKATFIPYAERAEIVANIRCVHSVIPENDWAQKRHDIVRLKADVLGMGDDWTGKFDELKDTCEVIYLPRTAGISSTTIKDTLKAVDRDNLLKIKDALGLLESIVRNFE